MAGFNCSHPSDPGQVGMRGIEHFWLADTLDIDLCSVQIHIICWLLIDKATWLEEAKEERDLEREALSVTGRCWETTSRESPSLPSEDWLVVEESSVSLVWSMRRLVEFLRFSLRMSSEMLSPTLNTPRGRLSLPWMLSMPSRGKDVLSTDSEVKLFYSPSNNRSFLGPPTWTKKILYL